MDFSWVDIIIVVILVICAIKGLLDGFVKAFLSFFIVIAGVVAAKIFSPALVGAIKTKTTLYENISQKISQKMALVFTGNATPSDVTDSARLHNIPDSMAKHLEKFIDSTNKTIGSSAQAFGENAANIIVTAISFIAILLVVILVCKLIVLLLDKVMSLPVLNTLNKLGGFVVGIIKGVLFAVIISTLLYSLNVFLQLDVLSTAINNSLLVKYFYLSFLFS